MSSCRGCAVRLDEGRTSTPYPTPCGARTFRLAQDTSRGALTILYRPDRGKSTLYYSYFFSGWAAIFRTPFLSLLHCASSTEYSRAKGRSARV